MSIKKCQKCGSPFNCEGDKDCWCEKLNIHKVQMLEIMEQFNDCLCPDCMKAHEARE